MEKCKTCEYEKICEMPDFVRNDLKLCKTYTQKIKKTNADRIRKMNDEELADFLEEFEACDVCKYLDNNRCTFENPCVHEFAGAMIYDWLQSEVKGSDV